MRSVKAFTLLELLLALFISVLVMVSLFYSFNSILKSQVQQSKIAETNLISLLSLEIMRKDLEMAGFGLPWDLSSITYFEAVSDGAETPSPDAFNDAPSGVPRAVMIGDNVSVNNSDVLVIKATIVNYDSPVAQKYGILSNNGTSWGTRDYSLEPLEEGDHYIILDIDDANNDGLPDRKLISSSSFWYCSSIFSCALFSLLNSNKAYLYLGISSSTPRMPFNRVDYYLKRPDPPDFPDYCSPNSYELYRAVIKHDDGTRDPQPILDCVMDFQVAFGVDNDTDGLINFWTSDLSSLTPEDLRKQLKQVRVFILAQEGGFDPNFQADSSYDLGDEDTGVLSSFSPSGDDVHYRWRVLKLVVNPLNMMSLGR